MFISLIFGILNLVIYVYTLFDILLNYFFGLILVIYLLIWLFIILIFLFILLLLTLFLIVILKINLLGIYLLKSTFQIKILMVFLGLFLRYILSNFWANYITLTLSRSLLRAITNFIYLWTWLILNQFELSPQFYNFLAFCLVCCPHLNIMLLCFSSFLINPLKMFD